MALPLVILLAGCGGARQRVLVAGAPSLNALFGELSEAYQQQNPKVTVAGNFTCPPCMVLSKPGQLLDFDLFAGIGPYEIERLEKEGGYRFAERVEVGSVGLVMVTSRRVRTPIRTLADLHREEVARIGIGDPDAIGVGHYAREALQNAGLWEELQPRFVYSQSGCELLKWLGLGRGVDAAIVFDVCAGEETGSIQSVVGFPTDLIPPVPMMLAVAEGARDSQAARGFLAFVQGPEGQAIIERHRLGAGSDRD